MADLLNNPLLLTLIVVGALIVIFTIFIVALVIKKASTKEAKEKRAHKKRMRQQEIDLKKRKQNISQEAILEKQETPLVIKEPTKKDVDGLVGIMRNSTFKKNKDKEK